MRDLGFTSSNDRSIVKVLRYIGMLDSSGRPQQAYREFTNHTKSKAVLGERLRSAFDDLFLAHKNANEKSGEELKGWFKSKTGEGDAVSQKIASTFKALAANAEFSTPKEQTAAAAEEKKSDPIQQVPEKTDKGMPSTSNLDLGLVYRIEVHLPDTQNVETYRAIFKALREELVP